MLCFASSASNEICFTGRRIEENHSHIVSPLQKQSTVTSTASYAGYGFFIVFCIFISKMVCLSQKVKISTIA